LRDRLRIALGDIRQEIQAQITDSEISSHLGVEAGSAVLYVETFLEDASGAPLEYSKTFYRGDYYKYTVALVPS
jgi:GntR family transcriptional regulator